MKIPTLYRKRLIPDECVLLKDDILLWRDDEVIITKWNTLKPKKNLHHGFSCYFLSQGIKVSKFYGHDNQLLYWYCDIVEHSYDESTDTYIFTDLLADVIIEPDGFVKVVDLEELADAVEAHIITQEQLNRSLRTLNNLLTQIYRGEFGRLTARIEKYDHSSLGG